MVYTYIKGIMLKAYHPRRRDVFLKQEIIGSEVG